MKSLLKPGIFLLAVAALLHTGLLAPNVALVTYAFCAAIVAGLLLAWRFHSSRIFFSVLSLFLAQQAISYFSQGHVAASWTRKHRAGRSRPALASQLCAAFVSARKGIQLFQHRASSAVAFRRVGNRGSALSPRIVSRRATRCASRCLAPAPLPFATLLAFAAAAIVLLIRYLLFHKPVEGGLFWALAAIFLSLHFGGVGRIPTAYFAAAAFILAGAIVETSYLLAYRDELTALPSRRAFHEVLLGLATTVFHRHGRHRSLQALQRHLRPRHRRSGVAHGGVTPGASQRRRTSLPLRRRGIRHRVPRQNDQLMSWIIWKSLRSDIESSKLRLRGPDRRQQSRGPDRRNQRGRGRTQTGHAIRQLSRATAPASSELSVTASIGVATSRQENPSAEEVIQAADKALYRAKAAGRNRIETAAAPRRRTRSKAAGHCVNREGTSSPERHITAGA